MTQPTRPNKNFEEQAEVLADGFRTGQDNFRDAVKWVVNYAGQYPEQVYGTGLSHTQREVGAQIVFTGLGRALDVEVRRAFVQNAYETLEREEFAAKLDETDVIGKPTALIEALVNSFPSEMSEFLGQPVNGDIQQNNRLPVIQNASPKAEISEYLMRETGLDVIRFDLPELNPQSLRQGTDELLNAAVALQGILAQTEYRTSTINLASLVGGGRSLRTSRINEMGARKDTIGFAASVGADGNVRLMREEMQKYASERVRRSTEVYTENGDIVGRYTLHVPVESDESNTPKKADSVPETKPHSVYSTDLEQLRFTARTILGGLVTELNSRVERFSRRHSSISEALEAAQAALKN